jgi:hypothetical protein
MAQSSILGADRAPTQAPGRDSGVLGPSDSSDSGSDIQGEVEPGIDEFGNTRPAPESDSDAEGTGERASAAPLEHVREGGDIAPDRVRRVSEEALTGDTGTPAEDLEPTEDIEASELALEEGDEGEQPDDEPDSAA